MRMLDVTQQQGITLEDKIQYLIGDRTRVERVQ